MFTIKIKSLLLLAVLLSFYSCKKEIPYKPKSTDKPKLVVNAFLSQPDSISVHISKSASVLAGETPLNKENAIVKIFSGKTLLSTLSHKKSGYYIPSSPINLSNNIEYIIEASAPNFKTVTASQFIPKKTSFNLKITASNVSKSEPFGCSIDFEDDPSNTNYYAVYLFTIDTLYQDSNDTTKFTIEKNGVYGTTNDPSVENMGGDFTEEKYGKIFLVRDDFFNGKKHNLKIALENSGVRKPSVNFMVELQSVTKELFNYLLTRQKYQNSQEDPFSQPVQIFSNITNGLGIFGGYASTTKIVSADSF